MGTDRTDARYFLKFLSLRILATQLKELATSRSLLRVRPVQKAIQTLYLRADSIVAEFAQVDLASALAEDLSSWNVQVPPSFETRFDLLLEHPLPVVKIHVVTARLLVEGASAVYRLVDFLELSPSDSFRSSRARALASGSSPFRIERLMR
jgi:hypothetical protein